MAEPDAGDQHVPSIIPGKKKRRRRKPGYRKDLSMSDQIEDVEKVYLGEFPRLPQAHQAVNYQQRAADPSRICGLCRYFIGDRAGPDGQCTLVASFVLQAGTCDLFTGIKPVDAPEHFGLDSSEIAMADSDTEKSKVELHSQIIKVEDEEQQLVAGVVLAPDVIDAQDDVVSAEDIEKAAHQYMADSRRVYVQHNKPAPKIVVVESWIAKQDITIGEDPVTKGSWVMVVKVNDDVIWKGIKSGAFTGFSIRGTGVRTPVEG